MKKIYIITAEQMQEMTDKLCALNKSLTDEQDRRTCTRVQDTLSRAMAVKDTDRIMETVDAIGKLLKGGE